jgi:hypothetical protein
LRAKRYVVDGEEFLRPEYDALAEAAASTGASLPDMRFSRGKKKK